MSACSNTIPVRGGPIITVIPGLLARLVIFRNNVSISDLFFLRVFFLPVPPSDSELDPSLDELPLLLLLLLELLDELHRTHTHNCLTLQNNTVYNAICYHGLAVKHKVNYTVTLCSLSQDRSVHNSSVGSP